MKKYGIILFMVACLPVVINYWKIELPGKTSAMEREKKSATVEKDSETGVRTDLDELRYDFDDREIEDFLELHDRARNLKQRRVRVRNEIEMIEEDIEIMKARLTGMKDLHNRLQKKFSARIYVNEENAERLVKTYQTMKPAQAAPLILKHKFRVLLKLLDMLKSGSAAKIFTEMLMLNRNRVVSVVEKYTGFDTPYTKELMKREISEKDLGKEAIQVPHEEVREESVASSKDTEI